MSAAYNANPSFYHDQVAETARNQGSDMAYKLWPMLDEEEIDMILEEMDDNDY